jgi:hypothetical protein
MTPPRFVREMTPFTARGAIMPAGTMRGLPVEWLRARFATMLLIKGLGLAVASRNGFVIVHEGLM